MDITDISLQPGRYIVAVSGGVDSMVLLHLLQQVRQKAHGASSRPELQLTVAHFDHGIRPDSAQDRRFVQASADAYGLPFAYHNGHLGAAASEATARRARYDFLQRVRTAADARAIITAHHQDDVLETAILNIVRGSGRRGLTSLQSTDGIKRPMLHLPKSDIVRYARDNQLLWHEDSTNASDIYKRNYVRHAVLPRFSPADRQELEGIIKQLRSTNHELDGALQAVLSALTIPGSPESPGSSELHGTKLDRNQFILLPHAVAREVIASWLRANGQRTIDSKMLERLVHASKTFAGGQRIHIAGKRNLQVTKHYLALSPIER